MAAIFFLVMHHNIFENKQLSYCCVFPHTKPNCNKSDVRLPHLKIPLHHCSIHQDYRVAGPRLMKCPRQPLYLIWYFLSYLYPNYLTLITVMSLNTEWRPLKHYFFQVIDCKNNSYNLKKFSIKNPRRTFPRKDLLVNDGQRRNSVVADTLQ